MAALILGCGGKWNKCHRLRLCLGEFRPFSRLDSKNTRFILAPFFPSTALNSLLVCLQRTHLIKHLVNANILQSGSPPPTTTTPAILPAALLYSSLWTRRSLWGENKESKKKIKNLRSNNTVSESNKKLREKLSGQFYVLVALWLLLLQWLEDLPSGSLALRLQSPRPCGRDYLSRDEN